jgi:asparaginyl-tRNA synthetase
MITNKSWNRRTHYLEVLNNPLYKTLADIQNEICQKTHHFYLERGICTFHFPFTTSSISSPTGLGSDSTPVRVKLFGIETYLSDSMQFYLEYGCRLHKLRCFCILPSFRGERADNTHLSQFYHSEVEIPGSFEDAINLAEKYLKYISLELLNKYKKQIQQFAGKVSHIETLCLTNKPFPRISLEESIKIVGNKGVSINKKHSFRLINRVGEQKLIEEFGGFVWLTNMDHLSVPFYQAFSNSTEKKAKTADLLFGLGEGIGLGERHETAQQVRKALKLHRIPEQQYKWYTKLREKHPMKTSGFGLGVERFICWLLNHNDIRDCQLFPRFNGKSSIL